MFSITIKRSVATLGVVAGLLAAAVPASAMVGGDEADTVTGNAAVLTDYDRNGFSPQAPTSDGLISITADAGSGNDALRADSNEVAVEGITLGVVTNNNDPDTMGRTLDNTPMDEVVFSATSNRTNPRPGDDKIWNNGDGHDLNEKGNNSAHSGVQPREPATITLCHEGFGLVDYDGSPIATYSKESSQDDGAGNDTVRAVGLPALSNEVAVEGFMDYTDDDCMARRY